MIKSMTGYGNSSGENAKLKVVAEVKSLNSKFLDLNLRLPKEYSDREFELRNLVSSILDRGKITVSVEIQEKGDANPTVCINRELVKHYYKDLLETAQMVGATQCDLLRIALTMPKAINMETESGDNTEDWNLIFSAVREAFKKCDEFRLQEGQLLAEKLKDYIQKIESALERVIEFDPQRITAVRERIHNHFEEFKMNEIVDPNRFEQELVYYIEKLDINEEKVRLRSHLDYFLETMKSSDGSGKKLGFIAQEIGREINTIGSKANDANIQRHVVEMKEELEKIKEQVLNIL
jgi:uncharacterized protein (TIGR00255 family)